MITTTKNCRSALAAGGVVECFDRAPRFVVRETVRADLSAAMGNRAFFRAWAACRSRIAAHLNW
jgi:hypothetical protein